MIQNDSDLELVEPAGAQSVSDRSFTLMEFDKVLRLLARHTTSPLARQQALELRPSYHPDEVARLQRHTAEAIKVLDIGRDIDLSTAGAIASLAQRAALKGALTGAELRQVAAALVAARRARHSLARLHKEAPGLSALAESLPELAGLQKKIESGINPQGEVADTASPEIHRLREGVRQAHDRLVTNLRRIIRSSRGQEVLQEPVFTIRSERMVLPVKAEMKGRMPGLVHDVSDTGATVFVEPYEMVELGNSWRELLLEEQREVLRVLRRLSQAVGEHGEEIARGVEVLAELDLILARGRLGRAMGASPPLAWEGEQPYLRLVDARHPLLPGPVVPLTLEIHSQRPVLLITGPNAGGKTIALKTLGLLTLMYQAGLLPPAAEGSAFSVFDGVYADIGDQQSIEQAHSTFSSHIHNITVILRTATKRTLVLLDELGTNTDPEEGSALARAVLGHLCHKGTTTIATGHFRSVASFVEEQPGMTNASVELNPETLMPTYRLSMGLPGRSYALIIASRLGLPQSIIAHAQELLPPGERRTDDLLLELQQERAVAVRLRAQAGEAQQQAQTLRQELEAEALRMASSREEILGEMRRELSSRAEEVRRRLVRAERALEAEADMEQVRHALDDTRAVRLGLKGREWRPPPAQPPWWRDLSRGDRVKVKGLNMPAIVLSPPGADGRVEVLMGSTRARFDGEQLESRATAPTPSPSIPLTHQPPEADAELHLRGQRVEPALQEMEFFLDRAVLRGLNRVLITHGRGTGALRQALRERLARHPLVKSFSSAQRSSGGDGSTMVELD